MVTAGPFIFIAYMFVMFMIFSIKDKKQFLLSCGMYFADYIVMLVCNLDVLSSIAMH